MNCDFTFDELVERYQQLETYTLEDILKFITGFQNTGLDEMADIPLKNYAKDNLWKRWSTDEKITYRQEMEVVEFVLFKRQALGIKK